MSSILEIKLLKCSLFVFMIFFLLCGKLAAQEASGWKTYTSKKKIIDAIVNDNKIWAVSYGGAFSFNITDSIYTELTRAEGINGIELQSITIDNRGKIWLGSQNGIIDVYNPNDGTNKTIYDIYNSNNIHKGINGFLVRGNSIITATDFGIVIFNDSTYNAIDSYLKFGYFSSKIKVTCCYYDSLLYIGTTNGIAIQKTGAVNLAAPESWDNYTTAEGLISNSINKITAYKNSITASTDAGISVFSNKRWSTLQGLSTPLNIVDIKASNDSLFVITDTAYYQFENGKMTQLFKYQSSFLNKILITGLSPWFSSKSGIIKYTNNIPQYFSPNSPAVNQFNSLAIDGYGNIWSSSGKDASGVGAYYYDGLSWHNVNTSTIPGFPSNAIYNVSAGLNNTMILGTWGQGFIVTDTTSKFKQYSYKNNSPMVGISIDPKFLVITDSKVDSKGNLWLLNFWSTDKKPLACLTKDSVWYSYPNYSDSTLSYGYEKIIIDQSDTKWYIFSGSSKGLFFFNENKTLGETSDDKFGNLTSLTAFDQKTVFSFVTDKRGELWIGTNNGLFILYDPSSVLTGSLQNTQINSVFSLRQYSISCIAVDALNRKWIGTHNQGLILVSPDGNTVLAAYNILNSPLLSDNILSLAIDDKLGTVYVGLDNGLMSFTTTAIKPNDDFLLFSLFPNPYLLASDGKDLNITGLVKESEIKVLNISGKVIRSLTTPGGKTAKWDGRDNNGSLVSSGIYIFAASDKEGNSIGLQKVAVVRK